MRANSAPRKPSPPRRTNSPASIFHLVTTGQQLDNSKFTTDQFRYQKRQGNQTARQAKSMGFELIPLEQAG